MKRRLMLSSMAATAVAATGCAGPSLDKHIQAEPRLDLRAYFNGVGTRKDDTELMAKLQAAMDAMKADGTAATISTQWFGKDIVKK